MKDDRYWAPINVGAKTAKNKATEEENTDITEDCGKLFQWGRLYGFAATNDASTCQSETTDIKDLGCPVQADLTNMSKWDGKFIYSTEDLKYNWLQINGADNANPEDNEMEKGAWYQQLWNANEGNDNSDVVKTATDPCPKGWRVPTSAEWIAIGAGQEPTQSGTTWNSSNLCLTVPGKESGKNLLLPAAGCRSATTGVSCDQGTNGDYWSSVPSARSNASNVNFRSEGKLHTNTSYRAAGFSVRCIQE